MATSGNIYTVQLSVCCWFEWYHNIHLPQYKYIEMEALSVLNDDTLNFQNWEVAKRKIVKSGKFTKVAKWQVHSISLYLSQITWLPESALFLYLRRSHNLCNLNVGSVSIRLVLLETVRRQFWSAYKYLPIRVRRKVNHLGMYNPHLRRVPGGISVPYFHVLQQYGIYPLSIDFLDILWWVLSKL